MRIVCLQHIDYEGPEMVGRWAAERGHELTSVVPMFELFPDTASFDMLVVLGGPMGAYEQAAYPWLAAEKAFIADAVAAGRRVLGICLGSQLLAEALGGRAHPHTVREVGWIPVRLTATGTYSRVLSALPEEFVAGEWHGDTFELPEGVKSAAESDYCANQAFEVAGGRVVGVQFHLEWTTEALLGLVERHGDWLAGATGEEANIETKAEFLGALPELARGNGYLYAVLDRLEAIA